MEFISRLRSQSFILEQGRRTIEGGLTKEWHGPARISFHRLYGGWEHDRIKLPIRGGVANGRMDSSEEAELLRRQNFAWVEEDPETREEIDVTERKINQYLLSHRKYGVDFWALGKDGTEVFPEEGWLLDDGQKGAYCTVCKGEFFKTRHAAKQHAERSAEHQRRMSAKSAPLRRAG